MTVSAVWDRTGTARHVNLMDPAGRRMSFLFQTSDSKARFDGAAVEQLVASADEVLVAIGRGRLSHAHRLDGRQAEVLEVQEHGVLAPRGAERQLLQRIQDPARVEEADEVSRRADGDVAERKRVCRPVGQGSLPRQLDEVDRAITEAEPGKADHRRRR